MRASPDKYTSKFRLTGRSHDPLMALRALLAKPQESHLLLCDEIPPLQLPRKLERSLRRYERAARSGTFIEIQSTSSGQRPIEEGQTPDIGGVTILSTLFGGSA